MKKILSILLVLALVITGCGNKTSEKKPDDPKKTEKTETKGIVDGVYETSAEGYKGKIKVSTTIKNGKIESVKVLENSETPDIGGAAIKSLTEEIVKHQSLSIDTVSGATLTSEAILNAVKEAIKSAKGNLDDFMKKVDKKAGKDIEKIADIIVIGGGGAGLSAAVSAAENGSKVILIEKTAALGGNTVRAGGPFNAVDPERQKSVPPASELAMKSIDNLINVEPKNELHKTWIEQLKKDLEEYNKGDKSALFDSVALHILQTYNGGDYEGNLEFVEKLAKESLATAKWLESNGVEWKSDISTVPGGLWPRAHTPKNSAGGDYIVANEKKAKDLGVEIMLECTGKELIMKDGKVVGVEAQLKDGTKVKLTANKAVILATGGFAANKEMRQKYNPSLTPNLGTTNSPAITGDGILLAEKVNANLVGMEYIQSLPLGNPQTGSLNGWMGGIGVEYYYQINKDGVRFMAEDGRRDTMTAALLAQKDSMSYVITDTNRESENSKVNLWGDNIEELVEKKIIFRANTIKELAEQIGVDPSKLEETHNKFNSYVSKGSDDDFGRKLFGDSIDTPPFYASPRMPTVHHTMGGIQIDLKARVLDKNGKVIPGLYACGEVTGGIHGKNRLGGNALVDIHVFGREAGKNAATGQ